MSEDDRRMQDAEQSAYARGYGTGWEERATVGDPEVYPMRGIEAEFLVDALETYLESLDEAEGNPFDDYDEDDLAEIRRKIGVARRMQERLGSFVTRQKENG